MKLLSQVNLSVCAGCKYSLKEKNGPLVCSIHRDKESYNNLTSCEQIFSCYKFKVNLTYRLDDLEF